MTSSSPSSALLQLAQAKRLKAELDALRPLDPAQEARIWQKFRLDWNYHSNHIEGNSLTFGETKALLLHNITASGKPLKDHLEIHGHNGAIHAVLDFVKGGEPLTEAFVRQLHQMILRERYEVAAETPGGLPTKRWIEVGMYKTAPNHVKTKTGETFHFSEPFETPAKMQALVDFVNQAMADPETDGLALAAQVHYQFVVIHPFDDGNGRMARLLLNFILVRYGYPPAIVPTETKEDYFAALRMADGDDLPAFVEFVAARVVESLGIMLSGARGDEIEKIDDLFKRLELIQELGAQKFTQLSEVKSEAALRLIFQNFILPMCQQMHGAAERNGKSYLQWGVSLSNHAFTIHSQNGKLDGKSKFDDLPVRVDTPSILIGVSFSHLAYTGFSDHHNGWQLECDFRSPAEYVVRMPNPELNLSFRYDQLPSSEDREKITRDVTAYQIGQIERTLGVKAPE